MAKKETYEIDEGYDGPRVVRERYPAHVDGGSFDTSTTEYKRLVKIGKNS